MVVIKDEIEINIANKKKIISQCLDCKNYSEAMHLISKMAYFFYEYNQTYTDEFLEKCLENMVANIPISVNDKWNDKKTKNHRTKILFYDGFGLDTRGLVQIYIRAFCKMNVDLLYITVNAGKGNQPQLMKMLHECNAKIVYLKEVYKVQLYPDLCKYINDFQPEVSFLYTTPWDVPGIMAFMYFKGKMKRYQINLTDHAFWLGVNAFDFCLEFRNFGASISNKYRKISREKLIMQPYYPMVNKNEKFLGFPFNRECGDFIIFSGGALYKTFDSENTYYNLIKFCLDEFPNTKFWYAGTGDDTHLRELIKFYPNRVFYTSERKDLFAILLHVDMYLNTIPLGGGLMTQYAALAGRPPFMMDSVGFSSDFLLNQHGRQIEFYNIDDLKTEIRKFITNPSYRKYKESLLKHAVLEPDEFFEDIKRLIQYNKESHTTNIYDIDTRALQKVYFERYVKTNFEEIN